MGLIRVWKDRKRISPNVPRRARTGWMVVVLLGVLLLQWLLGRLG
jgi:hypothetical protein